MRGAGYGFPDIHSVISGDTAFVNKLDWIRNFPVLNKAFGINPIFGYGVLKDNQTETRIILSMQIFESFELNNIKEYISLLYPDIEDLDDLAERIMNITDHFVTVSNAKHIFMSKLLSHDVIN